MARWGWDSEWAEAFVPYAALGHIPGRVTAEHKHIYTVQTAQGELLAEVTGKFRFAASEREDYPAVGDWLALSPRYEDGRASIHAILPRRSKFSRKIAGNTTDEQIAAVNVDTVFLIAALNGDFNLRRLERYLIPAWESGAQPVIVLSKSDLCDDPALFVAETEGIAPGVPVHAVSAVTGAGMDGLAPYLTAGRTLTLLGSSGAGKSSLTNFLAGSEVMSTGGIREDDSRGRHTTTHRELIPLAGGALMIDTPGMRELQLWSAEEGMTAAFADIEELAEACRFGDCTHRKEPGCAVQEALRAGTLERSRYDSFRKLESELAFVARKEQEKQRAQEKGGRKQAQPTRGSRQIESED
ncbi:ribosome small subunit-dependent GTPase A [Gorillibacterium sp. sgz500922]|uniref:ribosome small subunit-dependent GTPase A n=1 Tax=Gorillibacterium sp. sgz500922 TaxID=3446694 RepID=UPI003F6774D3